jgi:hypothetical protein
VELVENASVMGIPPLTPTEMNWEYAGEIRNKSNAKAGAKRHFGTLLGKDCDIGVDFKTSSRFSLD